MYHGGSTSRSEISRIRRSFNCESSINGMKIIYFVIAVFNSRSLIFCITILKNLILLAKCKFKPRHFIKDGWKQKKKILFWRRRHLYTKREESVYCLLRANATLRKGTVNFVESVCPPGTTRQPLDVLWWNLIFEDFSKLVMKIQISLKSNINNGSYIWRLLYSMMKSLYILLRILNVPNKHCTHKQNIFCINKIQQDATVCRCLFTAKSLYMFQVSITFIIRST